MTTYTVIKATPKPKPINVVGSLLFTVLTLPLRLLQHPTAIPPGYSITTGRSTLDLWGGKNVDARWYFPDADGAAPQYGAPHQQQFAPPQQQYGAPPPQQHYGAPPPQQQYVQHRAPQTARTAQRSRPLCVERYAQVPQMLQD